MAIGQTFQDVYNLFSGTGAPVDLNDPASLAQARAKFAMIGQQDYFDQQITAARSVTDPTKPPPPPDIADPEVLQARLFARRRAMLGAGMDSTFLTGPLGDMSAVPTSASLAGGG